MTDLFPSSPFFANMARSTEEDDDDPSALWQWVYVVLPRVQGVIYLTGAIPTLVMAWKRREFVFHRLALAMAGYAFLAGVFNLVGSLAIPADASGIKGNYGTQLTCTVQGFFLYVSTRTMFFYYSGLSFYSYVGILCGFQKASYKWCEKWIHIVAPIFPVTVGLWLLVDKSFNPINGRCFAISSPVDCNPSEDTCVRGSLNMTWQALLLMVEAIIGIVFPTVIMVTLYFKLRKKEQEGGQMPTRMVNARDLSKQSCIYLFLAYLPTLPYFVLSAFVFFGNQHGTYEEEFNWVKGVRAFASLLYSLFGLFVLVAYRYVTIDRSKDPKKNGFYIFSRDRRNDKKETDTPVPPTPTEEFSTKYSFNIFDGTNATGAFAEFIHDGDSDDERQDNEQTTHWSAVQDQI
mmetsp:Transcript_17138/g.35199  ORF Transcript_17138/g.35199 Transcript_17138/m.35199 type:complete len:403 (-) Transcript_17138:181-1389(-)